MATPAVGNPRYEAHESPSLLASLGFGLQFSLIASATLLVTPVIVASESGEGEWYVVWMVFASLVVVGLSTLLQVRRTRASRCRGSSAAVHGRLRHSHSASRLWWTEDRQR